MATTKKRIYISVSDAVEESLHALAVRDQVPQATKAVELLELALEIEEDAYFAKIVQERLKGTPTFVSHEEAWS